jgi:hypothetical protein
MPTAMEERLDRVVHELHPNWGRVPNSNCEPVPDYARNEQTGNK